jgi:phospholipid/cholesterol/gamma-HCH transport system ATP-binding protein
MTSPQNKITVSSLHKSFGDKHVLNGINLNVPAGESLVIIGGSGSGKSVLLKTIVGLFQPDKGSIKIDHEEVAHLSIRDRNRVMQKMGVLFQGGALFDSLPIWENVAFMPLQNKQITRAEAKELAISKLASVGLGTEVLNLFPSELSGGMQKRVALARAIAGNPEIIFFDEPTTGLDPIMADVINDLIVECSKELGATTFTITHDMASVRKIANRVAMIYKGKILWQGTVEEMDHSGNEYVEQFIHGRATGPIQMEIQDH